MAGDESVRFMVAATTDSGAPLPLQVVSSMVTSMEGGPAGRGMPIAFSRTRTASSATLQPSKTAFRRRPRGLRVSVRMGIGAEEGEPTFDSTTLPFRPDASRAPCARPWRTARSSSTSDSS